METIQRLVLYPFSLALTISLLVTMATIWFFRRRGWVVDPSKVAHPAHIHKEPVPKGGGIPIGVAVILTSLAILPIDKHLAAILLALGLTVVVGVIDDLIGLPPLLRLGINFVAAAVIVGGGIGIAFITNPLGGGVLDLSTWRFGFELWGQHHEIWVLPDLFALLWIPFLMNAVNFSSGVDGQASGMIAIAAGVIGWLSLQYSADITQWPVAVLAFALAGAFAGLTVFHFYPQKIMPGYGATTAAGLMLGVLSILSTTKVGTAMMVLGLPLIDAIYTIGRRLAQGKSPWLGDRGHLHHRLLQAGWGKRRVALFYWLVTAVLGALALSLTAKMKLFAILGLALAVAGLSLWLYFGDFLKPSARGNG